MIYDVTGLLRLLLSRFTTVSVVDKMCLSVQGAPWRYIKGIILHKWVQFCLLKKQLIITLNNLMKKMTGQGSPCIGFKDNNRHKMGHNNSLFTQKITYHNIEQVNEKNDRTRPLCGRFKEDYRLYIGHNNRLF